MVRGLVKQHSYFQMRLEKISASATFGAGFIGETTSYYRTIGSDFTVGIQLKATYSGAGGDLVEINVPSLGIAWSDTTYGDLEARLYGDIYAEDDVWHISNAVFRGYRGGSLVVTASGGNLRSQIVQKVPSSIPLIGIPPLVQAYGFLPSIAGPPAGLPRVTSSLGYSVDLSTFEFSGSGDASIQDVYTFSGAVRGGWRWDVNGTKEQFPTKLQLITPPTISCGLSAPALPTVTSTDTWTNTADAAGISTIVGNATESTIQASWIQPDPDLSRRFRRLGDDYSALCLRFSLPRARRHGLARCNANRNDTYEEVIPERAQYLTIVGIADDPYEDALKDRPECLYNRQAQHAASPDGISGTVHEKVSEFVGSDVAPLGTVPAYRSNNSITAYWDFLCNPHWSHKLLFDDWSVDGEDTTIDNYWSPIRSQWQYNAALPVTPRLETRNHILLDSIDSCVNWHEMYMGHGPRNLGLSRWHTVDITPWASHSYTSASSALFTTTGASAVFGASIQLTNSSTSIQLDLDLGNYQVTPYQTVHSADQVVLNWSTSNVSSLMYYLVGWDGTEVPVASGIGTYTIPRGSSKVYAGSWKIDNGAGIVVDVGSDSTSGIVASGVSHAIMADPETVHSFNLGPTSTYQTLRAKITTTAGTGQVITLNYPALNRVEGTAPSLVWESGQVRDLLYKNQSGIRYGNTRWWDPIGLKMYVTPVVRGVGTLESAVDQLATERVWLEKLPAASGSIVTSLRAQFTTIEGSSIIHYASNTGAPWLPNPSWTRVQLALTNDWSEVPPLCLMPRKARDTDWQETGTFVLDIWSWILGNHRFVRPGYNTGQTQDTAVWDLYDTAGNKYTTVEAGYVDGWNVSKAAPKVNNNEDNWPLRVGNPRYALVRPFRGYFGITASGIMVGETNPWQYQEESGVLHQTSVKDGRVIYRRADQTVPLPQWTVETTCADVSGVTQPRSAVDTITGRIWMSYIAGGSIYRRYSDDGGLSFSSPTLVV